MNIDLAGLERNSWRIWFEDGLLDMLWGVMLIQMFVGQLLEQAGIPRPFNYLPIMAIALIALIAAKMLITRPRLGKVQFSTQRAVRRNIAALVAALTTAVSLVLLVAFTTRSLTSRDLDLFGPSSGTLLILFFIVLLPLVIIAWLLSCWRMAAYGVVLVTADLVGEALKATMGAPWDTLLAFALPGAIILMFGCFLLTRFLRRYPRESVTEATDNQS